MNVHIKKNNKCRLMAVVTNGTLKEHTRNKPSHRKWSWLLYVNSLFISALLQPFYYETCNIVYTASAINHTANTTY